MTEVFDYGKRLSDEEYDQCIVELQSGIPPMPSKEQQRDLRQRELELAINHRLGINFPKEKRESLWKIMEKVERKRARLAISYALRKLFGRSRIPRSLSNKALGLAGYMVEQFSEVLTEDELHRFFDLEKNEKPALPLHHEKP